ncbi:MAG: hypothetical protein CR982_00770 [Candidatus Cloacimonadota bacterium]|nr:MAG: hypothetical protein CR982_00770 [Candidatus Cloacimonadota bacterium]PIE79768.1 MAG: hypothetical protein CSA15_02675 [Candidatus Delongbacteria bacterium]
MLRIGFIIILVSFISLWSKDLAFKPMKLRSVLDRDVETLKILAIRVEFVKDQLNKTTGDGKFDLDNSVYPDTLTIDAPPHNKEYFLDHLEFQKNYFRSAANGMEIVESYEVLDSVYTVPNKMWFYNLNNPDSSSVERLKMLHRDSWSQVINDESIDFTNYNCFVIFHAGSGQEFSTPADFTPFDIPSVYLNKDDLSDQFKLVTHDGVTIDNSIILPECEWQIYDGNWYMAGLNGAAVLMFFHRLGLPNLYKAENKSLEGEAGKYRSGVGRFDPMDQGSGNFSGLIPARPSAWSRSYLGWNDVENLLESRDSIPIRNDSLIYKIDLNDREYYLIENRLSYTALKDSMWSEREQDSVVYTNGYDRDGREIKFYIDKKGNQKVEVPKDFRVVTSVDNYDFAIPASGLFVWHIDKEKTTEEHISNNSINSDFKNKGVYLEEADGSFNIGEEFSLFQFGHGKEIGWLYDAYFDSNYVWKHYANKELYKDVLRVELSDKSYPPSDTNDGVKTGIRLYDFSNPGSKMYFSYTIDNLIEGFPLNTEFENYFSTIYQEKFVMVSENMVRIYYSVDDYEEIPIPAVSGEVKGAILENILLLPSMDRDQLILFDLNTKEFSTSNAIFSNIRYINEKLLIDQEKIFILDDNGLISSEIIYDSEDEVLSAINNENFVFILTKNGVNRFNSNGEKTGIEISNFKNMVMIFNPSSLNYYLTLYDEHRVYCLDYNLEEIYPLLSTESKIVAIDDLTENGKPNIISERDNSLEVTNMYGTLENNFPIKFRENINFDSYFSFLSKGKKVVALLDKFGNFKFITLSGEHLRAYSFNSGKRLDRNYQLMEKDGEVVLYTIGENGLVRAYSLMEGELIEPCYSGDKFGMSNNPFIICNGDENNNPDKGIVSGKKVYNWPNPIREGFTKFRFYLNKAAKVNIDIFDISGDKVDSLSKNYSNYNDYFELKWEPNLASGIYFAKVKFSSNGSSETYTVKVAVIR